MMEKRTLVAIVLAIFVMMAYSHFAGKYYPQQASQPLQQARSPQGAQSLQEPYHQEARTVSSSQKDVPSALYKWNESTLRTITTDVFQVTLSDIGGCIKEIVLLKHPSSNGEGPIVLTKANKPEEGIFALDFGRQTKNDLRTARFKAEDFSQGRRVSYSYRDGSGLDISKTYIFSNSNNDIELELTVSNNSSSIWEGQYEIVGGSRIDKSTPMDERFLEASFYINDKPEKVNLRKVQKTGVQRVAGNVRWSSLKNKYFSALLVPFETTSGGAVKSLGDKEVSTCLRSASLRLMPGASATNKFLLYAGANDLDKLVSYNLNIERSVSFGIFGGIGKILLVCLKFFYGIVHNYGVAIILLTGLISTIMYPLTVKSMKSMRQMQQIQPKVEKLKKEIKDNPQKLQKEIMELYRKHKVNPMGGCLPLFLQLPIFIALYHTLVRTIELRGASFLWINDLSKPDMAFKLPTVLPILKDNINILPIMMAVAMFLQQKVSTPKSGAASDAMQQQQKMMMIFMPLMMGVVLYNFPSGLVLYWFTNTLLMLIHQLRIKRHFELQEVAVEE